MLWIIAGVIVVVIAVWAISVHNKLVGVDELCGNALSQIGVQLTSRWDALTALADLTKGYSDHEYNAMVGIMGARQGVGPKSSAADVQQQEDLISQMAARIMAVAEAYPELKANTIYLQTMDSVKDYEENVRMSRMVYNDTVTKFNRMVRVFPDSVVAAVFGFRQRGYLQMEAQKAAMPSMAR